MRSRYQSRFKPRFTSKYATSGVPNGAAGSGVPWTPTQLGSAVVRWYDAISLGLANGTAVSSWTDLSASAQAATQGSAGSRPSYQTAGRNGKPSVRFDGGDALVSGATGVPVGQAALSLLTLAYGNASLSTFRYMSSIADDAGARMEYGAGSTQRPRWSDVATNVQTGANSYVDADHLALVRAPAGATATVEIQVDGAASASNSIARGALTPTRYIIGAEGTTGPAVGNFWLGDVMLQILTNTVVSDADAQRLFGYAAHRYGVSALLPVDHPYKSAPPTI